MDNSEIRTTGYKDTPIADLRHDIFKVSRYIEGLSRFIVYCDTPMTVAIQGDWGSGKTSMMNMVSSRLKEDVVNIWFNTWQFSQFDLQNGLAVALFTNLLTELECGQDTKDKVLHAMKGAFKTAMVIGAEMIAGGTVAQRLDGIQSQNTSEVFSELLKLKDTFQRAILDKLKTEGKNRVVIFIDDLDRLQPEKAVEFLEVLKIFLDCEGCVFVLAVDYEIVTQGIRQKFGRLVSPEKGRSFFDKIIQLPFRMPVAQYNILGYIENMLRNMQLECDTTELTQFEDLVTYSTGRNPRTIKRLFNAFQLLDIMSPDDIQSVNHKQNKQILFGILCMQFAYESLYNYIIANISDINEKIFKDIMNPASTEMESELKQLLNIRDDKQLTRIRRFCEVFVDTLQLDDDNSSLSKDELDNFRNVLTFSTVTSVGTERVESAAENRDRSLRRRNRNIIKKVGYKIEDKYKLDTNKIYQIRKENEDWTFADASGQIKIILKHDSEIKFWFEYKIHSVGSENEIWTSIWNDDSVSNQKFKTAIKELHNFSSAELIEDGGGFYRRVSQLSCNDENLLTDKIFQALQPVLDILTR
jgi:hypothetical protein